MELICIHVHACMYVMEYAMDIMELILVTFCLVLVGE